MVAEAYHSIAVSLMTGTFALAVVFALIAVYAARTGRAELLLGSHFTTKVAAGIGIILGLGGVITGFLLWPAEAVFNSALMKNKLFTVAMMLLLWVMYFAVIHLRGISVWRSGPLTLHAVALAVFGFLGNVISNSIGGDVAGNPSGFEQVVRLFGVDTRSTFYLPTWLNIALIVVGFSILAVSLWVAQKNRTGAPRKSGP